VELGSEEGKFKAVFGNNVQEKFDHMAGVSGFDLMQDQCLLKRMMVQSVAELSLLKCWLFTYSLHGHLG